VTTWTELEEAIRTGQVSKAILPIGSFEQHGPHLPLSTDTIIAEHLASEVSKSCNATFLLPSIHLGCSSEHLGFAGTISLRPKTMRNLIIDISRSLIQSGLKRLFIINGHGGNKGTIDATLVEVKQIIPEMRIYSFTILDIAKQKFEEIRKSKRGLVGHADEIETSMMLAIAPRLVNMAGAVREKPSIPEPLSFEPSGIATISFAWNARDITHSGVIGDPTLATAETGRVLLDFTTQTISKAVNQL